MPLYDGHFLDDLPVAGTLAPGDEIFVQQGGTSKRSTIGSLPIPPSVSPHNPTASVGLAVVNGVASTFMRSDAAPPLDVSQSFAFSNLGNMVISANGAASLPGLRLSGTWFSGGSFTTTKPHLLIEPPGTTSNFWSTSGTAIGVNAAAGFAGDLISLNVSTSSILWLGLTSQWSLAVGGRSFMSPSDGFYLFTGDATLANGNMRVAGGAVSLAIPFVGFKDALKSRHLPDRLEVCNDTGWTQIDFFTEQTVTNTAATAYKFSVTSTGTPAAGFGQATLFNLQSSTTVGRTAAHVEITWATATDATRKGSYAFFVWDTAAREALRLESNGSQAMISFFGGTPNSQQTITGLLASATTVADLQGVLQSLLAALATKYNLVVDGTT